MTESTVAALLPYWWRRQARPSAAAVAEPQLPLTASASQDLPDVSPTAAALARPLSSWGTALARLLEPEGGGAPDGLPPVAAGSVPPDGLPSLRLPVGEEQLVAVAEQLPARVAEVLVSLIDRLGEAGVDLRGRLKAGGASSGESGGAPLCSCAICLGMASGARRELIDRFGRRPTAEDLEAAAGGVARGAAAMPPQPVHPAAAPLPAAATPIAQALTIADKDVFNLETNPGASKTIYLNFLGANLSGTAWIPSGSTWNGVAPAFSLDSDTSTNFSAAELAAIKQIFARIACDYAPFNVNVTTKAPSSDKINRSSSSDSVYGTVCLFSNISSQTGYSNAGGVAYVGVFNSVNAEFYKPALVFPNQLGNSAKNIAEAASHEIGHNLNLSHDGTSTTGYYQGQGSSPGWAPIMGVGYYKTLTQFSRGTYSGANNTENDFALIAAEGVGYWLDAIGNDRATAASLTLTDANGDGVSDKLQLGGTIELTASNGLGTPDRDFYSFLAPSDGNVTINVRNALYYFDPAAAQYTFAPVPSGYGNLRIDARLEDASGLLLADWSNNASLDVTNFSVSGLSGGRNYYLSVFANASSPDGEDAYGSLGDYVLDLVYQGQPVAPGLPAVSVALAPSSVTENSGQSLVYTFTRSGSTDAALSINYTIAGTATADDFSGAQPGAGTLQFGVGSATATLTITPNGDTAVEADETVVVSLASGSGYSVGTPASVSGTIRNDDVPPTYTLSGATSVQEGQALSIGIATTGVVDGTSLNWRFTGTGITADDFSPAALTGSVTVTGNAASLPLTVAADNAIESTETALIELLNGSTVVASRSISLLDTNRLWGTTGNDTITGSANRFEWITGVVASGTTAAALGTGQVDVVTGGAGPDDFLLSEIRSGSLRVFYNDNANNRTGTADYLRVKDFQSNEDKLRFGGGRYFSRTNGSDTWIWFDRNNNGSLNTANGQSSSDELIAVLQGVQLGSTTMLSGSATNPSWVVFG